MLGVSQIRRHIADGTLPYVRPRPKDCGVCVKTKLWTSYPGSLTNAKTIGRIHTEVKGMLKETLESGAKYF